MKRILILGAGRSSSSLINYLIAESAAYDWYIVVADKDLNLAQEKVGSSHQAEAISVDLLDKRSSEQEISKANLVISMLPPSVHIHVAEICAALGRNMLTASYLTEEMKLLEPQFVQKNCMLLMELGLDPGIDHMSAMKVLDRIKDQGYELTAFETFTGGLLAPSRDDNPWQYKFTWNPRNVVLAGQGVVKFLQQGRYKYIPYHRLFRRTEVIYIPDHGYFEGYANRDSLKYLNSYNLQGIKTLYRGTLRRPGFCKAWDIFVQLGATDDSFEMEGVDKMTHRQFINSFLRFNSHDSVELKIAQYLKLDLDAEEMHRLKWLGIFEEEPVGLERGTPAQVLEHILKKKWTIGPGEKDMIVMWHKFDYLDHGISKQIQSNMVAIGEDSIQTAMSKTVGLPLGIAAKLLLTGKINIPGVHIPTKKEIYEPVLQELTKLGIEFQERELTNVH